MCVCVYRPSAVHWDSLLLDILSKQLATKYTRTKNTENLTDKMAIEKKLQGESWGVGVKGMITSQKFALVM